MGVFRTASLDRTAFAFTLLLVAAPAAAAAVAVMNTGEPRYVALTVAVLLSVVCAVSYAIAPCSYHVRQDRIIIRRHLWLPSSIPMSQVRSCYPYPELARTRALRLIGNGGAFGWYGTYSCDELGTFRMYATDRAKAVVIGNGTKFVLSPERQETFLAAVNEYARLST
ncbi:MAG: PH domain-containing protein [bacterium]